jgi:hypothetical protein
MGPAVMALPCGPQVASYFAMWHVPTADPHFRAAAQVRNTTPHSLPPTPPGVPFHKPPLPPSSTLPLSPPSIPLPSGEARR